MAESRRGSFMNSNARFATSRLTSCSVTKRAATFFDAFTRATMLDGTPLADAITRVDAEISPIPRHYVIGCLYPTHAQTALQAARPDLV